jgi:hypothetical protein
MCTIICTEYVFGLQHEWYGKTVLKYACTVLQSSMYVFGDFNKNDTEKWCSFSNCTLRFYCPSDLLKTRTEVKKHIVMMEVRKKLRSEDPTIEVVFFYKKNNQSSLDRNSIVVAWQHLRLVVLSTNVLGLDTANCNGLILVSSSLLLSGALLEMRGSLPFHQ